VCVSLTNSPCRLREGDGGEHRPAIAVNDKQKIYFKTQDVKSRQTAPKLFTTSRFVTLILKITLQKTFSPDAPATFLKASQKTPCACAY
jgi:hypothetical protein